MLPSFHGLRLSTQRGALSRGPRRTVRRARLRVSLALRCVRRARLRVSLALRCVRGARLRQLLRKRRFLACRHAVMLHRRLALRTLRNEGLVRRRRRGTHLGVGVRVRLERCVVGVPLGVQLLL